MLSSESEETIDVENVNRFYRIHHPYVIVTTQDCDLEQDYGARQGEIQEDKLLEHILFCPHFLEKKSAFVVDWLLTYLNE